MMPASLRMLALSVAMLAAEAAATRAATCASVPAASRISCNTYNISFSTTATTCHARGCCWDGQVDTAKGPACYYAAPAVPIRKVVIINADHFDLGYHGLISQVANMYFDKFWPLALKISADLRAGNHTERYVYTTFSWLASAYLSCVPSSGMHCPNASALAEFKAAAKRGDITWPAFPFNSEHAAYDPGMVQFGVNMTHELDDLLGVPRKKTLANRDVPGLSRSLIPLLSDVGVKAINIAPNAQMAPANVPPAFIWKDVDASAPAGSHPQQGAGGSFGVKHPSGKEMLTLFWDGWNYGLKGQPGLGCDMVCFQTFPGCDTAVYFDWSGEDSGPNVHSADAVLELYAQARARFPGAEVAAGGLDDIVDKRSILCHQSARSHFGGLERSSGRVELGVEARCSHIIPGIAT